MRGAAKRFWISSPLRMWGGFQPQLRKRPQLGAGVRAPREAGKRRGEGQEAEELGAEGEEQPVFLPVPSFMGFDEEE